MGTCVGVRSANHDRFAGESKLFAQLRRQTSGHRAVNPDQIERDQHGPAVSSAGRVFAASRVASGMEVPGAAQSTVNTGLKSAGASEDS